MDLPILPLLNSITVGEYDMYSNARLQYTGAEDIELRTPLSHPFASLKSANPSIDRQNARTPLSKDVGILLSIISDVVDFPEKLRLVLLNREIAGSTSSETPIADSNDIICAVQHILTSWESVIACEDEFGHYADFCMECEDDLEVALEMLMRCLASTDL